MPQDDQVGLRGLRRRHREARRPPPGDPGPVPAADRQERRRLDRHHRSSATCRTSTSRSAGSSSRRARAPGRSQPPCVKKKLPWQGKIREVDRTASSRARSSSRTVTEAPTTVPNAEPTLRLRGVGRRFGGLLAVRDVDLDVAHGERRAILGPNGAGKTTLFNVISGDLAASSGTVELFGEDVTTPAGRGSARSSGSRAPTSSPACSSASPSRTASTSRSSGSAAGTCGR